LASAALVATIAGVIGTVLQARTARIERDFALRQLSRAEAINDLNSFVLSDAAPSGKPFTVNDLLARAEQLVTRQQNADDANRAELLISIGSQYLDIEDFVNGRRLLEQAYALARKLSVPSTRARAACALATVLGNQGDLPGAEKLIQEGLNQLQNDERYALDRVACLQQGSSVASFAGHSRDAVSRAKGAGLALRQSAFQPDVLELDNLILLAGALSDSGQVREADAAYREAAARLVALGRDDTMRAQRLFNDWAVALWKAGRPLDAERVLRQAIAQSLHNRTETATQPALLSNYAFQLTELNRL